MKREAKILKRKGTASLTLAIEHFNRPWDLGRVDAVLILLDHSLEMLLKASILHRGGAIRRPREKNTIGFDDCVRRALSSGSIRFLTDEQGLALQAINGLRDAAQHHVVDISESHLYIQAQIGVTVFKDILLEVFGEDLRDLMPERVLPIATVAPADPIALYADEVEQVARLLRPGQRRKGEAKSRLRALAIVDGAMLGERLQPSEGMLEGLSARIAGGERDLTSLFPGLGAVAFSVDGQGPTVTLRIAKKEGIPVQWVPEGQADSSVLSIRRVAELDFYNLRFADLAEKLGISTSQLTAMVSLREIKASPDYAKLFFSTWCYSQNALTALRAALEEKPASTWWNEYRALQAG